MFFVSTTYILFAIDCQVIDFENSDKCFAWLIPNTVPILFVLLRLTIAVHPSARNLLDARMPNVSLLISSCISVEIHVGSKVFVYCPREISGKSCL